MHKVGEDGNQGENFFVTGLRGWQYLFSKLKGKKKEDTSQNQQANPQPQQTQQQ